MRTPLPVLVAALVAVAAGVATLHIVVPNKPTTIVINASTLAAGQNITLHLDYIPMNITVIKPNPPTAAFCMYYRGVLVDQYGTVWVDRYTDSYPGINTAGTTSYVESFSHAIDMYSTNVTILFILGQSTCPAAVH
jgi:hypothetical protein